MRPILYTDTLNGQQVLRDDLWSISTGELNSLESERDALKADLFTAKTTRIRLEAEAARWRGIAEKMAQALGAIQFGSLEANFKQCTQTDKEIATEALGLFDEVVKEFLR